MSNNWTYRGRVLGSSAEPVLSGRRGNPAHKPRRITHKLSALICSPGAEEGNRFRTKPSVADSISALGLTAYDATAARPSGANSASGAWRQTLPENCADGTILAPRMKRRPLTAWHFLPPPPGARHRMRKGLRRAPCCEWIVGCLFW